MKKQHMSKQKNSLVKAFLTTACQYIVFGVAFVIVLKWLSEYMESATVNVEWIYMLLLFTAPVLGGWFYRLLRNRGRLYFCMDSIKDKASIGRLVVRLTCVCLFVFLGIIFVSNHELQLSISHFLYQFGKVGYAIADTLSNTNLLFLIGLFPATDAIVEWMFATNKA